MAVQILKVIIVMVIIALMILVLVSINHYLAGGFNCSGEDIDELRRDVSDHDEVVSEKGSFGDLIHHPVRKTVDKNDNFPQVG